MARTEQDKITQAPIEVTLGDKKYKIKPLRVLKQQQWREKARDVLGPLVDKMQVIRTANNTLVTGLPSAMAPFADHVRDLLFAYAPYLPKDEILDEDTGATEEQIALAFSEIWNLVYQDFLGLLARATEILKNTSAPANASN